MGCNTLRNAQSRKQRKKERDVCLYILCFMEVIVSGLTRRRISKEKAIYTSLAAVQHILNYSVTVCCNICRVSVHTPYFFAVHASSFSTQKVAVVERSESKNSNIRFVIFYPIKSTS